MLSLKLLLVFSLLFSTVTWAFDVPPFRPNVVDETKTLSQKDIDDLNDMIQGLRARGVLAAIYLTPTLDGETIEDAAEEVFRKWALGEKGKDNGLLIMLALEDRRMRIEVGYGLEGDLTDFYCSTVIQQVMKPKFKERKYAVGLKLALEEIELQLSDSSTLGEEASKREEEARAKFAAIKKRFDEEEANFGPILWERFKWWTLLVGLLPGLVLLMSFLVAFIFRLGGIKLLIKRKAISYGALFFGARSKEGAIGRVCSSVFLGVFVVTFPAAFQNDLPVVIFVNTLGLILIGFTYWNVLRSVQSFFSRSKAYRFLAMLRLQKIRRQKGSGRTYQMFGRSYSTPSRSSSSSSSSSSSGGGRSGGGGASGSW